MNKTLLIIARSLISIGLLAYLIYLVDVEQVFAALAAADRSWFLGATALFFVVVFLLAFRWKTLIASVPGRPGYRSLLTYYLIGYFFNNFLPTSIGGDVSRIYYLTSKTGDNPSSVASVLLERVLGVTATLSFAAISLVWVTGYFSTAVVTVLSIAIFSAFGVILIFIAAIVNDRLSGLLRGLIGRITFWGLGEKINAVLISLAGYRRMKEGVLTAYAVSLLSQFSLILMNFVLARSLGLEKVTIGFLILVIPVTFVISLVPSINGLGVRDLGYVVLLTQIGVSETEALSLSFLNTLVPMLVSMLGGILFLVYRNKGQIIGDSNDP